MLVAPPSTRRARFGVAPTLLCAGLVVIVIGTFLPWLKSGQVSRNSYASDGAARRLLDVHGALDTALRAWPFVSLVCAGAAALVLLGLYNAGALLAVLAAACAGSVAGWALQADVHGLIRPTQLGPTVTLIGAGVVLLAAFATLIPRHHFIRRNR